MINQPGGGVYNDSAGHVGLDFDRFFECGLGAEAEYI